MNRLNLDCYTDKEIVAALFRLPAQKFMTVVNATSVIVKRLENRGDTIAKDNSDVLIDEEFRRFLENGE